MILEHYILFLCFPQPNSLLRNKATGQKKHSKIYSIKNLYCILKYSHTYESSICLLFGNKEFIGNGRLKIFILSNWCKSQCLALPLHQKSTWFYKYRNKFLSVELMNDWRKCILIILYKKIKEIPDISFVVAFCIILLLCLSLPLYGSVHDFLNTGTNFSL